MKRFLILFSIACLSVYIQAQQPAFKFSPREFMTKMEQFISQKAALTPTEAAAFFPLFEEKCKKQHAIFDRVRNLGRNKPATEKGCLRAVQERDKMDLEQKKLEQYYHNKYLKVLPPSKVYDVIKAEDMFHRHMFKNMAKKHFGQ